MAQVPLDCRDVLGLQPEQLPRHIAIIMDGNGRWAGEQDLPRIRGHERGAQTVRTIVTHCARLGIEVLTLFSFSTENWKRPREEVDFLMELYTCYLVSERETIMDNNVRFRHLGRREGLPEKVLEAMDETVSQSQGNTGLTLCLALNYGAREELVDAVRTIAGRVAGGSLGLDDIDDALISRTLYTAGLPDPDLLIRTAGEHRVSNFLLWQISYAELHVCEKTWPEFGTDEVDAAIKDFASRDRRFGGVSDNNGDSSAL